MQVSKTGEILPLKTGTAVREDVAGRPVGMVCRSIPSLDARFIVLPQKMHGFIGMAGAGREGAQLVSRSLSNNRARRPDHRRGHAVLFMILKG